MRRRDLIFAASGALAAATLAGGVAWATIPGDGGVIQGCYTKIGGILRVIDVAKGQKCLEIEIPISWNQKGQKGDRGRPDRPAQRATSAQPERPARRATRATRGRPAPRARKDPRATPVQRDLPASRARRDPPDLRGRRVTRDLRELLDRRATQATPGPQERQDSRVT